MKAALIRTALVLIAAAVLVAGASFAPRALRGIDAFRVQHVEVVGTWHLTPDAAVRAAGITLASNLFDDPAPWLAALHSHPLVAAATVERRVPDTIVLRIEESVPVAIARTPELRAIDASGRVLPAALDAADMDLPVLTLRTRLSAEGRAVDEQTLRAVRFLGIVARHEPGLTGWISEVGAHRDAVRLVLRSAADTEVLVSAEPDAQRLRELSITLAELAAPRLEPVAGGNTARNAAAELSRVRRIDARFHEQIVVSLHNGKS